MHFEEERAAKQGARRCLDLPDGTTLNVPDESILVNATELMFKPSLGGLDCLGCHEVLHRVVESSDLDIRNDLRNNIVLTGGNTLFLGLPDRLEAEIAQLYSEGTELKVIGPPERGLTVWIGGSCLSSLSTFEKCA